MPSWLFRLEGGPADGDRGEATIEPPPALWVSWCQAHGSWHWYVALHPGAERYIKVEEDFQSLQARFVYEDLLDATFVQEFGSRVTA